MGFDYFLFQSFIKLCIICSTLFISIDTEPTEVFFNGKQYISYKPSKNPSSEHEYTNRIQLEFRTIYSNGVLVTMKGEGDDVLVLQLVNGVLRYVISKTSEKQMEHSINSNLDDNKWHKIEIIRVGTLNKFILDNTEDIFLTPKTYKNVTFNKDIFIGGGYNSITKKTKSLSRSMFIGCLKLHSINNRDPISYLKEGNNRVKVLPNGQLHTKCTKLTSQPISLTKLWSTLRIQVDENRTESYLKLDFSVKTMLLDGRVISTLKRKKAKLGNYTGDKYSVDISLRDGYVNVKLIHSRSSYSRALQTVKAPISISDGTWHYVHVLITNDSATIEVDGERYEQNLENSTGSLFFNPTLFFLGNVDEEKKESFIGCLHGIKLNSKVVPIPLDLRKGMFERICKLPCKPNPCQNNGICSQRGEDYHCDCTNTNFYGEKCEIYKYKSSCAEYMQMGLRTPSFCLLDADGTGELHPYTGKCGFDNGGKPYTVVSHNYLDEINTAVDEGNKLAKYRFYSPKYVVKSSIIDSLIKNSESCRQEVRLRCKNTVVFDAPSGVSAIHWTSRQKNPKSYWGGVKDGEKGCACGKTNECNEKGKLCNCDSKTLDWATDEGYLTEKKFLPVQRIQVNTAGLVNGSVHLYIGPLQCFAKKKRVTRSMTPNNTTLKRILSEVCMSVTKKDSLLDASLNIPDSSIHVEDELPYNPTYPVPSTASSHSGINPKIHANKTGFLSAFTAHSFFSRSRTFGVLEIVVLSFAGLAFLVLVIKFICCDRFCSRNDRGELILNQVGDCCMRDEFYESVGSQSNDGTMTKNNNGLAQNMKVTQNPLSSYWV